MLLSLEPKSELCVPIQKLKSNSRVSPVTVKTVKGRLGKRAVQLRSNSRSSVPCALTSMPRLCRFEVIRKIASTLKPQHDPRKLFAQKRSLSSHAYGILKPRTAMGRYFLRVRSIQAYQRKARNCVSWPTSVVHLESGSTWGNLRTVGHGRKLKSLSKAWSLSSAPHCEESPTFGYCFRAKCT